MATRQDVISTIEGNVTEVILSSRANTHNSRLDVQTEDGGVVETHGIQVLVLRSDGGHDRKVQKVVVKYDNQGAEVEAWIEGTVLKDHVDVDSQASLLARFAEIETEVGGEVKVDPAHLDKLGIQYLVFEAGGVKKVTATVAGQTLTRDSI